MLVLPIVLLFALAGVGALVLAGTHGTSPPAPASPKGPILAATDGAVIFRPLEHAGEPPNDILGQLPVPVAANAVGRQNHDRGNGVYDREVDLRVPASYAQVVAFYQAELVSHHWVIVSQGPPRSGTGRELLARRPSSDGFFWEVGATIREATPGISSPATALQLRLLEDEEQQ